MMAPAGKVLRDFAPEPGHVREHVLGILRVLTFTVVAPLVALAVLQAKGIPLVPALAASAAFPAGEVLFTLFHDRHVDALGILSFALIALGAVTSILGGDIRFALVKESAVSVIFGALCLGSLLGSHSLMYYLGREFFAGGDPHRFAAWEKRAEALSFRAALRTITLVWGIVSVLEALLRVGLVFVVAPSLMAFLSPGLAVVTTLLLIAWSVWYFAHVAAGAPE
ncbi:MAG TPA: VC0807 family protein [Candidatus Acidoferrales bacterium]|nr:VC0807 family protein [Candidatus Acidoferrales bacterium]